MTSFDEFGLFTSRTEVERIFDLHIPPADHGYIRLLASHEVPPGSAPGVWFGFFDADGELVDWGMTRVALQLKLAETGFVWHEVQ